MITSKKENFATTVNGLFIVEKLSMLDICRDRGYTSDINSIQDELKILNN